MSYLWSSDEVAEAAGGISLAEWNAKGVSIDSRTVSSRDLFIALTGPNFDGHDFVLDAMAAGAAAAIVKHVPENCKGTREENKLVLVDDTLDALYGLARSARLRTDARITAITGSVGKTGTKEALRSALSGLENVHANAGNLNNALGVPLSLARMPRNTRFGVFEMGMNHAGELTPLSCLVKPDIAIITAVEAVHLEFFESVAAIAEAKAEIFCGLKPGGTAILPINTPYLPLLRKAADAAGSRQTITFGDSEYADAKLIDVKIAEGMTHVFAELFGRELSYTIGIAGRHIALNSLAVLAAIHVLDLDPFLAASHFQDIKPGRGRGTRHTLPWQGGSIVLVDESYNASPASVTALTETLGGYKDEERRILVLGDMLELGKHGPELHAALAEPILNCNIDLVFTAGSLMKRLNDALPPAVRGGHAKDPESLLPVLKSSLKSGDVVAVKGSFGSNMNQIISALLQGPQKGCFPPSVTINGNQPGNG